MYTCVYEGVLIFLYLRKYVTQDIEGKVNKTDIEKIKHVYPNYKNNRLSCIIRVRHK